MNNESFHSFGKMLDLQSGVGLAGKLLIFNHRVCSICFKHFIEEDLLSITHPALSAVPSPRVTKAPSKFSATLCRPVSRVLEMSLAARPSCKD